MKMFIYHYLERYDTIESIIFKALFTITIWILEIIKDLPFFYIQFLIKKLRQWHIELTQNCHWYMNLNRSYFKTSKHIQNVLLVWNRFWIFHYIHIFRNTFPRILTNQQPISTSTIIKSEHLSTTTIPTPPLAQESDSDSSVIRRRSTSTTRILIPTTPTWTISTVSEAAQQSAPAQRPEIPTDPEIDRASRRPWLPSIPKQGRPPRRPSADPLLDLRTQRTIASVDLSVCRRVRVCV